LFKKSSKIITVTLTDVINNITLEPTF